MKRIALIIAILITSVGMFLGTASAFNEADLQKLKVTGNCVDCDLSGAVLTHWNLSGADLSGTNLAGADLTDAYLAGANLSGTNLSNVILAGANMPESTLKKSKPASLKVW